MTLFIVLAALMLAAALAIVLRPLLAGRAPTDPAAAARRRVHALNEAHAAGVLSDAEFAAKKAELGSELLTEIDAPAPRPNSVFYAAVIVALVVPALAIGLYRMVGNPQALNPAAMTAPPDTAPPDHSEGMQQAIAGLAAKLKQDPNNAEGWALLGRAYLETQQFTEARAALKRAHELVKNDPDVAVAYAEAITLASDSHRFGDEGRALLEAALKTDPKNQRGLWLLGIADFQDKKYDTAIADWKRLLEQLPKGSSVEQQVNDQIARAEAARDGKPMPPERPMPSSPAAETAQASAPDASPSPPAAGGPHLTVKVTLDPSLTSKVSPGDTVFIYAKAASGPPMPLAIQRLHADQLPATVVLTDGMGMLPSMKLSNFPQVIIGARISKSGNAIAQSGDLQTVSKPLDVATTKPIDLTIDQVVP